MNDVRVVSSHVLSGRVDQLGIDLRESEVRVDGHRDPQRAPVSRRADMLRSNAFELTVTTAAAR